MTTTIARVNPQDVLRIFKERNLKAIRHDYVGIDTDSRLCACGLGAIYADDRNMKSSFDFSITSSVDIVIELTKTFTSHYIRGFTSGFDGTEPETLVECDISILSQSEDGFAAGYKDGQETWALLIEEGVPYE